nr:hypothetical protein [uncultured Oscillibacter sp.]
MANPKGNPQNLQPVRTTDEAKKRGAAGGKKSGAARRKKRDARQAIRYVLDMAATGKLDEKLEGLGFDEEDRTNMTGLTVAMMMRAASGDVSAYKALMDYGGFHPDQKLKDRESRARIAAMENGGGASGVDQGDGVGDDVLIYMPENGRDDDGDKNP